MTTTCKKGKNMKSKIKSGYIVLAVLVIVSVLITIRSCVSAKNTEPVNFDVNIEYNNKSNVKNSMSVQ